MAEPTLGGSALAHRRERALQMAMESFGEMLGQTRTGDLLSRARAIEAHLWPATELERPHHACRECVTPSGKIACHTCGEAWPCSRRQALDKSVKPH